MANFRSIFQQNFFPYSLLISIFFFSCSPKDKSIAVLDYTIEKIDLKNNEALVIFSDAPNGWKKVPLSNLEEE